MVKEPTIFIVDASLKRMKYAVLFVLLLSLTFIAQAQQKPLTQPEYVKMLYGLQANPSEKTDIVDALRKRGIGFALTDGLRGLTRSKSGNDEELRQALEEAERRRQNPAGSVLPSANEIEHILDESRKATLAAVDEMPDFVVKQQIQRSAAYAGTGNFRGLDRLIVAVSYRSTGQEDYKVLSVNGVLQNDPKPKGSYEEVGGTSSTGEFVTMLATIFKPESEAKFEAVDTDLLRGRKAIIFDFSVDKDKAKQTIATSGDISDSTISGIKGRMWIDRENFRVLRVESQATEIPDTFPIRTARRNIDYDWVTIDNAKYLLPSLSDVRLTFREKSKVFETRNLIRFKDYQKYGTDVKIVDDDNEPIPEEKPNQ
jgi:hypothetical protein